ARSSMQESCGGAALTAAIARGSADAVPPPGPKPRMVAATATAIASKVMTVSAPLATDFSARNSVIRTIIPKKPAAANVIHIGKVGERQSWSSDEAQAQFMREVPHAAFNRNECLHLASVARMLLRTGPFGGGSMEPASP